VKAILAFGAATLLIVVVCGALLAVLFGSPTERRAIAASGVVALVVQLLAFTMARLAADAKFLAGWTAGVVLRFVTLVAYGFVAVKALGMPAPAALISLVTFLFVSTLIEPKLLTI
jgi:hypothetical protein